MKRLLALMLVVVMTFAASGCQSYLVEVIEQGEIALADGTVTQEGTQKITARALNAKVAADLAVPTVVEAKSGVSVQSNTRATVDLSNAEEGYVTVKYTGGKKVKIMVQIYLTTDNKYNYTLNSAGNFETYPLSEGDGTYTIRVLENTTGNKYACVFSCEVKVKLRNELLPFLYSNSTVNYAAAPETVKKAAELVKDSKSEIEKVEAVYHFVTKNVSYDYDFAAKVVSGAITGHVPVLDNTLKTKKGICFDYASLMAGMLRSQGVPVRLVMGYAGTTYHAWINVFVQGVGWIDEVIKFDGTSWTMMDPTFVSTSGSSDAVSIFVGTGKDYAPKQIY